MIGQKVIFSVTFYGEGLYFGEGKVIPTKYVTENGRLDFVTMNSGTGQVYLVGDENIRRMPSGN